MSTKFTLSASFLLSTLSEVQSAANFCNGISGPVALCLLPTILGQSHNNQSWISGSRRVGDYITYTGPEVAAQILSEGPGPGVSCLVLYDAQ